MGPPPRMECRRKCCTLTRIHAPSCPSGSCPSSARTRIVPRDVKELVVGELPLTPSEAREHQRTRATESLGRSQPGSAATDTVGSQSGDKHRVHEVATDFATTDEHAQSSGTQPVAALELADEVDAKCPRTASTWLQQSWLPREEDRGRIVGGGSRGGLRQNG